MTQKTQKFEPSDWEPSDKYDEWGGCFGCGHWRGATCIAYPKRIPMMIIDGQTDHMVPRPGQVGDIVYEPRDYDHWLRTGERRTAQEVAREKAGVAGAGGASE